MDVSDGQVNASLCCSGKNVKHGRKSIIEAAVQLNDFFFAAWFLLFCIVDLCKS